MNIEQPESQNLLPPLPPAKPQKRFWSSLLVFIFILAIFLLASRRFYKKTNPIVEKNNSTVKLPRQTLNSERILVKSHLTMTFPEISASSSLDSSLLPADLDNFIFASATAVSLSKLTFADGSQGYSIAYTEKLAISYIQQDFVLALINTKDPKTQRSVYSPVSGGVANLALALETQSNNYQVKIEADALPDSSRINIVARLIN